MSEGKSILHVCCLDLKQPQICSEKKQIQNIEMKTSPFLPILRLQQGWSPVVDFTKVHAGNLGDALTQVQGLKGGSGVDWVGVSPHFCRKLTFFGTFRGKQKAYFQGLFDGFFVSHYKDSLLKPPM